MEDPIRYKINPSIVFHENSQEGSTAIFNLDEPEDLFYQLKGVSLHFWRLLDQGKSDKEVIELISNEYQVSKEQVKKDFEIFTAKLLEKGIVNTKES